MNYRAHVIETVDQLKAQAASWNRLWDRSASTLPTVRARPLALHAEHFFRGGDFKAIVVNDSDGEPIAALPLIIRRINGFRVGVSPSNEWNHCHDWIVRHGANAADVVGPTIEALRRLRVAYLSFDLVRYNRRHWQRLLQACSQTCHSTLTCLPQYELGMIHNATDWTDFRIGLSKNLRRNLDRGVKKLRERGDLRYWTWRYDGTGTLSDWVGRAFEIENRGWKSSGGTSVLKTPGMTRFFQKLAHQLDQDHHFELHGLLVGDRLAAFDFGYLAKQTYHSLKVSYDPDFAKMSPGHVLMQFQIERFHELMDCTTVDTMGVLSEATRNWCTAIEPIGRVMISCDRILGRIWVGGYTLIRGLRRRLFAKRVVATNVNNETPTRRNVDRHVQTRTTKIGSNST